MGQSIIAKLRDDSIHIVVLTRRQPCTINGVAYVHWDAKTLGGWVDELNGAKAIINLVGKSVNCRYTASNKNEIVSSRVDATSIIGRAIQSLQAPPEVWINAGSAAIFGDSGDIVNDESSAVGEGFSPGVCKQWEVAFYTAQTPVTRKVLLRIGVVLQKDIGLLQPFVKLAKAGFGGKIGSGMQYISWIHESDFVKVVKTALENKDYAGTFHCTGPEPITNKVFMEVLRKVLKIKLGLPNIALFVRVGALFVRTEASLVLTGRRVISAKLEEKHFVFDYPQIEYALDDIFNNK